MPSDYGFETEDERRLRERDEEDAAISARRQFLHDAVRDFHLLEEHVPTILIDYEESRQCYAGAVDFAVYGSDDSMLAAWRAETRPHCDGVTVELVYPRVLRIRDVPQCERLAQVLHEATGFKVQITTLVNNRGFLINAATRPNLKKKVIRTIG